MCSSLDKGKRLSSLSKLCEAYLTSLENVLVPSGELSKELSNITLPCDGSGELSKIATQVQIKLYGLFQQVMAHSSIVVALLSLGIYVPSPLPEASLIAEVTVSGKYIALLSHHLSSVRFRDFCEH